ncbi:VOC family protein [Georgenia sp. TF02-10]|uniref:VOC family protein n=1 Tax=Georgenia sp. TF02-10 TaxID=2917725 RepID=UPI001FA6B119|nr:VOC family protein [Georgenia sp. TF02-10]UNX53802.1 VOC family protein [Georgenia sp. TF02-10]
MFSHAIASFSVDDVDRARQFYTDVLGLAATPGEMGTLTLRLPGGAEVLVYPKGEAHTPASFTVLNLLVADIDDAVAELTRRGVRFERYDGIEADDAGIARDPGRGPAIAWFTDPAGNVFAVMQADDDAPPDPIGGA